VSAANVFTDAFECRLCTVGGEVGDLRLEGADKIAGCINNGAAERLDRPTVATDGGRKS